MSADSPRLDGDAVFEVHAGSQTLMGYGFSLQAQLLVARGFTILFGNPVDAGSPHNSLPASAEWRLARLKRFTVAYPRQMLAIVDDWEARSSGSGRRAVHLIGGSSGGYMTNWLVACTDRFRSAVTERSICDLVSYYGSADIGYLLAELEHGGNPWEEQRLLWEASPLRNVDRVVTPILIVHSEYDLRCPVSQAEEWFTALRRIGRTEVQLIRFPDEGHDLSRSGRPDRRVARLDAIATWLEGHAGMR
jgi:dipeptidyl aminopeptidase/acylaminoacyl peptidase